MSTVVVTGATGFIGKKLATALTHNHNVVCLVRDGEPPEGVQVVRGELEDLKACERLIVDHEPDGIFHLGAQAIVGYAKRDPFATMESNVRGTYNLMEAFRRHRKPGSKMVVASSDKAYGELPVGAEAYDEGMPVEGRGPYDCSKSCTDLIAYSYGITYNLPVAIIRAGNVYGPGDWHPTRIIPSLVMDLAKFRPLTITSDGSPVRDYVYVHDVVDGYIAAWTKHATSGPRAYNLAARNPMSVMQVAEEIISVARENSVKRYTFEEEQTSRLHLWVERHGDKIEVLGKRSGEIQTQVLDPLRAELELGWKAQTPFRQGLLSTIRWALYENPKW